MRKNDLYLIGGSPCCGKSTIAERIAAQYGFQYYKLDDHMEEHMQYAVEDGKPTTTKRMALTWDQAWMRPPRHQAIEEMNIYEEIIEYAMRDIRSMPDKPPIIAEGAGFLPSLFKGDTTIRHLVMIPTEEFQRGQYAKREWIDIILRECTDPDEAFDRWMKRDAHFAQIARSQAKENGVPLIIVDGAKGIDEIYGQVIGIFELDK